MSSVDGLREFVNERLSAAAEEIFGVFKRSIVEYQEEIDRQRGLLDVLLKPEVRLHRIELPQSRVCKEEEVLCDQQLCLQERNPRLDQEDPDPPQIKEEQEELCSSQEGEQLEPKQEADTFTLTPTCEETDYSDDETPFLNPDRSHSDLERKPPASTCTSWLDEEIDCERFVVPEPNDNNKEPQQQILASPGDRTFLCKKCGNHFQHENDTQESDRQDQKGVKQSLTSDEPQQQSLAPPGDRAFFGKTHNEHFQHKKLHWMDQQYVCNICGRRFTDNSNLKAHIKIHSGEKPYSCITCGKTFTRKSHLRSHTRIHTGEKPYPCKICERCFRNSSNLIGHIRNVHKCETL